MSGGLDPKPGPLASLGVCVSQTGVCVCVCLPDCNGWAEAPLAQDGLGGGARESLPGAEADGGSPTPAISQILFLGWAPHAVIIGSLLGV